MKGNFTKETTSTTGAVLTLTLSAFSSKFARFSESHAVGDVVNYTIENGDNWETGRGTIQIGNTLDRTIIIATLVAGVYDDATATAINLIGDSTVINTLSAEETFDRYDSNFVNAFYKVGAILIGDDVSKLINLSSTSTVGKAGQSYNSTCGGGDNNNAEGNNSCIPCGSNNRALGLDAFSGGNGSWANGSGSVSLGYQARTVGLYSVNIGGSNNAQLATFRSAMISSFQCAVSGHQSATLAGRGCDAAHLDSYAFGGGSLTRADFDFVLGGVDTATPSVNNNTIRLEGAVGNIKADGALTSPEADYAELFEWEDGNNADLDRVGFFVSLKKGKIIIGGERPIGIISGAPAIIGNGAPNRWSKMYEKDEWKRTKKTTYERFTWLEDIVNENGDDDQSINVVYRESASNLIYDNHPQSSDVTGTLSKKIIPEDAVLEIVKINKINPSFDNSREYVPREERKEWGTVGLLGQLLVHTSEKITGDFVDSDANGMAVNGDKYHVLEVIDESHVLILFK